VRTVALRGLQVLPVVGVAQVLATAGIILGLIALVIPGSLLWLRWAVVSQAAALEHEGPLAAIRSSGELTVGCYRRILGLLLIFVVLAFVVSRVVAGDTARDRDSDRADACVCAGGLE
jgi:hypothetical protein